MLVVIFKAEARPRHQPGCLDIARERHALPDGQDGFIGIERFQSLKNPGKVLSLSFCRDGPSLAAWRTHGAHRHASAHAGPCRQPAILTTGAPA